MHGLLVTGGEGPGPAICQSLARAAGLVAAADSGLEAAENAGIRPDWIVGDMDSLDSAARLEKYPSQSIRRFPRDKDYTDTELGLELLWEQGCDEVCVAGGGGGRLDHLAALFCLFERKKCPSRWVTAAEDIRCLSAIPQDRGAKHPALHIRCPADTLVSVFPLGPGAWEAESEGLKWPLNGLSWTRGSFGISNRTLGTDFTIRVIQGRFLIILPLSVTAYSSR